MMKHPDNLFAEILDALFDYRRAVFIEKLDELKQFLEEGAVMPNPDSMVIHDLIYSFISDEIRVKLEELKEGIESVIDSM